MLGSNQRPLLCESSANLFLEVSEITEILQIAKFGREMIFSR
jgi:hypothetical protein